MLLFPPINWNVYFIGPFIWVPLVIHSKELHLTCQLDIRIKSCAGAGDILTGGDLDNRLKLLLDALTVPQEEQFPKTVPLKGHDYLNDHFFFCLLQDDRLVTRLSIRAEPLLAPAPEGSDRSWAEVEIGVVVRASDTSPTHPGQF
jgi:hypothetical protein